MKFFSLPLIALVAQQALAIALPINDQISAELEARHQHLPGSRAGKFGFGAGKGGKGSSIGKGAAVGAGAGAIAAGAGKGSGGKSTTSSAAIGASTSIAETSTTTTASVIATGAADIGTGGSKGSGGGKGTGTSTTSSAVLGSSTTTSVATSVVSTATTAPPPPSNPGLSAAQVTAAQSSLTLDKSQVMPGLAQNGQAIPEAGQVPSLTSVNNFINYCLTQSTTLTNGLQTVGGSCNPVPMGRILATTKLPTSKFSFPANFGTIASNTTFTITMNVNNLVTGNFVDAATNYYAAPAQVDGTGTLIGHTHFVIEKLSSLQQTTVTNALTFAFFKGVNTPAVNGVVSEVVTGGLAPGVYRLACINTAANHQPALASVAQHGHMDDMIYFTVN